MTNRVALIQSGVVVNVVLAAEGWQPPQGVTAVVLTEGQRVGIRDSWDGSVFTAASPDPLVVNRNAVGHDLVNDLANMQTIIDGPATMTTAQLTSAVKALARCNRRLIRLGLQIFDAAT